MHLRNKAQGLLKYNLLSVTEAAEYLGLKKRTLDIWRSTKQREIPFQKVGGRIFYRLDDLDDFINRNRNTE